MSEEQNRDQIREAVRKHYAEAITGQSSCCGPDNADPTKLAGLCGYTPQDLNGLPEDLTTFGCGNPINFLEVEPGQCVLDLGAGAGLDLILAARKVGPTGKVIGLDMTDEMIAACRRNLERAGIVNAEVRKGMMENMPVADGEVDWIISNCVINLSPEKEKVFAESFRVLKPGGRVLVSDIVTLDLSEPLRDDIRAWVGCVAGAIDEAEYLDLLRRAGFVDVKVVERMVYDRESLSNFTSSECGCSSPQESDDSSLIERYADHLASVRVHARKPA